MKKDFSLIGIAAIVSISIIAVILFAGFGNAQEKPQQTTINTKMKGNQIRTVTDFPSLQSAVDSLPETGGTVYIPENTTISLGSTLLITKNNVMLRGEDYRTSVIKWIGDAKPVIRIAGCRWGRVERLRIDGGSQASKGIQFAAFKTKEDPNAWQGEAALYTVENVFIENLGQEGEGIRLGAGDVTTEDTITIRQCEIRSGAYGMRVTGPFSAAMMIDRCFVSYARKAGIAIHGGGSGPFALQGVVFGGNSTDIETANPSTFALLETGCWGSENGRHLHVKEYPGPFGYNQSNTFPQITIMNSHITCITEGGITDAITWEAKGGNLMLINNMIANGYINLSPASDKTGTVRFYDTMNIYGNSVFTQLSKVSPKVLVYSALYNWGIGESDSNWMGIGFGSPFSSDDLHGGFVLSPTSKKPALINAQSISGTAKAAHNLRGSVPISDNATSVKVTFEIPEPDENYFPIVQIAGVSGEPALGSTRVYATNLTKTGFTVNTEVAPGKGNAVIVCWHLIR